MSGWVPTPADGWDEVAEALTDRGKAWPMSAAVTDLRWLVDRRAALLFGRGIEHPTPEQLVEGIPGRPSLVRRWHWTDHRVRSLLRDVVAWWDSGRWKASPADRQRTASASPADIQPQHGPTLVVEEVSPADRQPVASRSPADLHTRVDPQAQAQPQPQEEQQHVVPGLALLPVEPKADGWDEVARVYADVYRPALGLRATSKLIRSKGIGLELARMTREHGAGDVVEVLRYIATATDDRPGGATFYREKQVAIESVRRHFAALLDKARNPAVTARASPLARGEWVDSRTPEQRAAADREADRLLAEWR